MLLTTNFPRQPREVAATKLSDILTRSRLFWWLLNFLAPSVGARLGLYAQDQNCRIVSKKFQKLPSPANFPVLVSHFRHSRRQTILSRSS